MVSNDEGRRFWEPCIKGEKKEGKKTCWLLMALLGVVPVFLFGFFALLGLFDQEMRRMCCND